jgi:phosphoribosylaminoimidazolecarboxamide formyltransferase/IMP cyclohydrolase
LISIPFEETVANTSDEKSIIEKIDVGGPSMIRGAAKNFVDVVVVASKKDYSLLEQILADQQGNTTLEQRKAFAAKAFNVCSGYDIAISNYFGNTNHLIHLLIMLRYYVMAKTLISREFSMVSSMNYLNR